MKVKEIVEGRIENGVWVDKPGSVPPPSEPDDGILNRPAPRSVKPTPAPSTPAKKSKPDSALGTIKNGVWTSDPPKKGEKGVPVPVPMDEAGPQQQPMDYEKYADVRSKGDMLNAEITGKNDSVSIKNYTDPKVSAIATDMTQGIASQHPEYEKQYVMNKLNTPAPANPYSPDELEEEGLEEDDLDAVRRLAFGK